MKKSAWQKYTPEIKKKIFEAYKEIWDQSEYIINNRDAVKILNDQLKLTEQGIPLGEIYFGALLQEEKNKGLNLLPKTTPFFTLVNESPKLKSLR